MPLRLDNAQCVAHMPTAAATKNKLFEPRFKIDLAASPMPKTRQPERLAPRATSNRNGGRDHLGILGEIKSVHPGEIIGIRSRSFRRYHSWCSARSLAKIPSTRSRCHAPRPGKPAHSKFASEMFSAQCISASAYVTLMVPLPMTIGCRLIAPTQSSERSCPVTFWVRQCVS